MAQPWKKLLAWLAFAFAGLPLAGQMPSVDIQLKARRHVHFVAYGDTRFTNPADTSAANPEARRELVRAIADAHPDFVTFGGDITYDGSNPADWSVYDDETAAWREKHIQVYPALGNHDLHGDLNACLSNYFQRFPDLEHSRYYSVHMANVLMLTLDSALEETTGDQGKWLANKLDHLPGGVEFVVVVLHHPPYTSSSDAKKYGGGHSSRAPEQALAAFLEERQKKMRARMVVFAGHVHNYERHKHGGVIYFVTGGGGAHAYPIERRPSDLFQSRQINYHYIDVQVGPGKMIAKMNRLELKDGTASWTQPDKVTLHPAPRRR